MRTRSWTLSLGLFGATATFVFGQASPLNFERVAPKPLPQVDRPVPFSTSQTESTPDETLLLPRLQGIVLLDDAAKVRPQGWIGATGVRSESAGLLSDSQLAAKLAPFIGKPATFGDLEKICAEIVRYYRDHNRPVVDAQLPEQEISAGVVQVLVLEGKVGRILTEDQKWFPEERFLMGIRSQPGGSIEADRLLDDLNWLNRNPFRQTDLLFRKGEVDGETDLVLKITDRLPFRPYVSYDNWGTDLTGNHRLQAGFNWGNVFGWDHILSYQFSTAPDYSVFSAHAGVWTIPLPWRHLVEVYGSYGRSQPEGLDVDVDAITLQAGIMYIVPLPNIRGIKHDFSFGSEFKQSNNDLLFGGTNIFDSETQILQFRGSYQARFTDSGGTTSALISGYFSPGGLTGANEDEAFQEERAYAEAEYLYGRVSLNRVQRLPANLTLVGTLAGQLASTNLLASEQFSLGGATTVRGYEEGEVNGDLGWLASVELYSPPIAIVHRFGVTAFEDELKVLAFGEVAGVSNVHLLPDEESYVGLSGVGVGARYRIGTRFSVRFDYAWPLQNVRGSENEGARGYISATLTY